MQIHVLGAGAGGGFPQWNCNCPNCDGYRKKTIRAKRRTQSSIAVKGKSDGWVLFNASPDLLTQIHDFPALQPARSIRDTAIKSIILIDSQIDHTTGLLMLRESTKPIRIYCTAPVQQDLTIGNPLFNVLSSYCKVDWQIIQFKEAKHEFSIPEIEGLQFTAYPLASKAPPYSPHREEHHEGDTIGVMVKDLASGKKLFYAPGLGEIENHVQVILNEADCIMVDGTFWKDDEMIQLGVSKKRSREIGHLPQSGLGGMIEMLNSLTKQRKILIHINNTNPILNEDSRERDTLTKAGIEVAFDGMEIEL